MRFFLDNDVPDRVGWLLRREGHSVVYLREALSKRASDAEALAYALAAEMILITCNRQDFLQACAENDHYGVILMIRRKGRNAEAAAVLELIGNAGEQGLLRNINFA